MRMQIGLLMARTFAGMIMIAGILVTTHDRPGGWWIGIGIVGLMIVGALIELIEIGIASTQCPMNRT